ncbi:MAG: response regulator [Candidatus Omnitrophica bacterium]|nr:response regulator [Candidatus Omnitrophota bacterium]
MASTPVAVLVFEDHADQARVTKSALEQEGFAVEVCRTGREGLAALSHQDYPVCLMDSRLPDMTGAELLRYIHAIRPRTVSIVVTSHEDERLAIEAMKQGAYEYMVKSPSMDHVAALPFVIREGLERLHLKDERSQLQTELWEHARLLEERNTLLRKANEELKRVNQMKSDFISMVSHELRTPLATIKEFAAILADKIAGPVTDSQRDYLAIIKSNVDRLARIIDDLLDMAKIEAGRIVLNRGVVEIEPLLDQVVQSIWPLANNKHIALELKLPDKLPPIFADADKVTQVLTNLVSNAVKFTAESGRVTISLTEQANDIEFRVADTGVGIAPGDLPKLFEKFQQIRPVAAADGSKGTGLGLAISKRLVELHGGRIWVMSELDRGSTFAFTIPRHAMEELFHECVKAALDEAKRQQSRFSIIVVSIPIFQELKALYGLDEASRLLKQVETALKGTVRRRAGDVVVRWRHGELVVILGDVARLASHNLAHRVKTALEQQQLTIGAKTMTVPIATATATYPDEGTTEHELLALIDTRIRRPEVSKTRILVIDDELKIRSFLKELLEHQEYEVLTAATGPEALELLRTHHSVDLILLDIMMPVMDGYEVYRRLKENAQTRDIPVLVVSAKGERQEPAPGSHHAAYNYVGKPFQTEELIAKVRETLVQQRALRS